MMTEADTEYVVAFKDTNRNKIDIMGPVSITADRLGLSVRQRTVFAASVVNAMGEDINKTNINRFSAWEKGKKVRFEKSEEIKASFSTPDKVAVH